MGSNPAAPTNFIDRLSVDDEAPSQPAGRCSGPQQGYDWLCIVQLIQPENQIFQLVCSLSGEDTVNVGREFLFDRAGAGSTFPQIFIGETHVGGCDELYALDREGKLDGLLAGEKAVP